MSKSAAKSLILRWFDSRRIDTWENEERFRGKLSAGIDSFFTEVASRDDWTECVVDLLSETGTQYIKASGQNWQTIACARGTAIAAIVPGWSYGWQKIFKDEYVYEKLSWLGVLLRQYIHRSYAAKILMIAWEANEDILRPFSSERISHRYTKQNHKSESFRVITESAHEKWGERIDNPRGSRSRWKQRNTLDPAIHEGIFHFLRGQSLLKANFDLEAMVAFDCVLQSLQNLNWPLSASSNPRNSRKDLCLSLGGGKRDFDFVEEIYYVRNQFGAHAGGWRWWDNYEFFDNGEAVRAGHLALRALQRAADIEPAIRRIDPAPDCWSEWLLNNFSLLWRAVGYRE